MLFLFIIKLDPLYYFDCLIKLDITNPNFFIVPYFNVQLIIDYLFIFKTFHPIQFEYHYFKDFEKHFKYS
jgi:hypothetical protein